MAWSTHGISVQPAIRTSLANIRSVRRVLSSRGAATAARSINDYLVRQSPHPPPAAGGRNRPQGARAPARDACAVEMGSVGARGARGLWAGSLGAARGRGADPIRVFRAPIGTASTHRATLGWHGSARTTRLPAARPCSTRRAPRSGAAAWCVRETGGAAGAHEKPSAMGHDGGARSRTKPADPLRPLFPKKSRSHAHLWPPAPGCNATRQ
jgi:hypothetical protein